jgi:hypothetical protein
MRLRIFIMVNIHPGPGGGGLTDNFITHLFYQGHYLPCGLCPIILAEVNIYPGGQGGDFLQQMFQPKLLNQDNYLTCVLTPQY